MDRQVEDHDDEAKGVRDVAIILPFIATVLFMPPIVLIFTAPLLIGGVPLIIVYIFGAWALMIAVAFLVARILGRAEAPDERYGNR